MIAYMVGFLLLYAGSNALLPEYAVWIVAAVLLPSILALAFISGWRWHDVKSGPEIRPWARNWLCTVMIVSGFHLFYDLVKKPSKLVGDTVGTLALPALMLAPFYVGRAMHSTKENTHHGTQ